MVQPNYIAVRFLVWNRRFLLDTESDPMPKKLRGAFEDT
jgi:hypothetical protein